MHEFFHRRVLQHRIDIDLPPRGVGFELHVEILSSFFALLVEIFIVVVNQFCLSDLVRIDELRLGGLLRDIFK